MSWLQLFVDTDPSHASAIESAILKLGAASVTFTDNADQPILEPALGETPLWRATRVTGLFDAGVDTSELDKVLAPVIATTQASFKWEQLEDKDWQREWMKHYQPIDCGNGVWICPSWCPPPDPLALNILLDPGMAFGTGTHPTTLLCLQWLAEQEVSELSVIDYGCGSGILGITALRMGSGPVDAVDIDPQALIATQDNSRRNHLPENSVRTFLPEQFNDKSADLVFANILAGPLVELAPRITALTHPGSLLCLSGILDSQAEAVMSAYREHFDFVPIRELDHWVQLAATRR
ncbi:50S ribosomal protein L11 methyltransferase [Aurantivibrio infirmus]